MDSTTSFSFLRALNKFIENKLRATVLIDGIVTAVNDDFTVDITINEVTYSNVTTAVLKGSQATIFEVPVIGSHCLVKWRDNHRGLPTIDSFDKVDKYYIQPISNLYISAQNTQFNDGSNGGLVLVNPLVTKINNLENLVNNLITQYNGHSHLLTLTSGTGTAAATLSQETGTIAPITKAADIQSTTITQ
jgi:hypothetical protein